VDRVEILGPSSIVPGRSAQYSAIQVLSNGSSRPATGVIWSSSQPALLQVNATGLATAQSPLRGEVTLQVEVTAVGPSGVRRASREILVLPDGTFRVVGTVTEADATNIPIAGARVDAAADADLSTPVATFATTGPDGRYKLYGVPAEAVLRVRKDGYVMAAERLQLATHETRNIQLRLEGPRPALAGDYTMTIEADGGACGFPDDLRRRTYDAVIVQNGPQLTVTLTSPRFLVDAIGQGNRFTGVVTTAGATFEIRSFADFYYPGGPGHPDVAELLPDDTVLVVVGTPRLSGTSASLTGPANSWLSLYRGSRFPNVIFLNGCSAARLTLTRR
jgi:carboxypeptidase family protein